MDVAVIVVGALCGEGERESSTILPDSIAVERRQTTVCRGIRSCRVGNSSNIFPDNGGAVFRCVVRGRSEKTNGGRGRPKAPVLHEYGCGGGGGGEGPGGKIGAHIELY